MLYLPLLMVSFGLANVPVPRQVEQETEMNQTAAGTNRLVNARSPYLLQHARNPVDWYPWGEEAFAAARDQNKPIFLSIGYATCHWCHVMAHESFEDEAVAKLMNDYYIAIKVDREERPDIDQIYMTVAQMMTGSGGWPLTIIMTPDKKPFFAGTYIPKEGRFGRMGMLELLPRLSQLWANEPERITTATAAVLEALVKSQQLDAGDDLTSNDIALAVARSRERFDARNGGFGSRPKFPSPHQLIFLLRQYAATGDESLLEMVETTLQGMRRGGIYDHVGFGFHRYSTDEYWLLPHFEKMLYDQAMLMMAYTEAYQATKGLLYAQTAHEIAGYISRDMTSSEGGFFSAEDADSEGEEGKFYLWTTEEIASVLGPKDARWVTARFNLQAGGNFKDESTGLPSGDNILHLSSPLLKADGKRWAGIQEKLLTHREARVRPALDDKILTDWNGLMIAALAQAGHILETPAYVEAAEKAAGLILDKLRDGEGRLLHRYRDGHAGIAAHLDDYAFLTWGLLNLYEATFNTSYLATAIELTNDMLDRFWDEQDGGLYFTADDSEQLLIRNKDLYDGAIPAGSSAAAMNLLRLGRFTGETVYDERAAAIGRIAASKVKQSPTSFTYLLTATAFAVGPTYEVVIAGDPAAADTQAMLAALRENYHPSKVVILRPNNDNEAIIKLAPFTKNQLSVGGAATAYVCRNQTCDTPTTDISLMLAGLNRK